MTMSFNPISAAVVHTGELSKNVVKALKVCAPELDDAMLNTLVTERPHMTAEALGDALVDNTAKLVGALSVLFGRGDIETAHAVISRKSIPLDSSLVTGVRRSLDSPLEIWRELRHQEKSDVAPLSVDSERARYLFEDYIHSRGAKIELPEVFIPAQFSGKFMLVESDVGLLLRTGGPNHRDIMRETQSELVFVGRPKAAQNVQHKGGGWVTQIGEFIVLDGASGDFGYPDYRVVKRLVSQSYPTHIVTTPIDN